MASPVRRIEILIVGLGAMAWGCTDVARFDTGKDGAYCGTIVGATFVRHGFTRQIQAELHIDTRSLQSTPGSLTSHRDDAPCEGNPLFDGAPLTAPVKLEADALSQIEFGGDREMNWLSWVHSSCGDAYLAVVSLMHDDSVELRLLRPPRTPNDPESGALGVFAMERSSRGCGNE